MSLLLKDVSDKMIILTIGLEANTGDIFANDVSEVSANDVTDNTI